MQNLILLLMPRMHPEKWGAFDTAFSLGMVAIVQALGVWAFYLYWETSDWYFMLTGVFTLLASIVPTMLIGGVLAIKSDHPSRK